MTKVGHLYNNKFNSNIRPKQIQPKLFYIVEQ